ncbi:crossover junction endodeoxyribonuclease RuvC [Agarilytica rhodophyticola]|uniref:crossover junction endodeoxyribonuclease RuvC n=1 Tax=Agarilytica rhodophyticola TaxID=1737490 RepID=UPI000B340F82|nr:hypothetical protein [Agarilytica rhodophyticola]
MDNLNLLSLDLGTTTGWAMTSHELIISGTANFKHSRYDGGGMRFLKFNAWLRDLHTSIDGIDVIYFEEVRRHIGTDAAHVYGGFLATLTAFGEQENIPYQGVPVGTIKKHITGKGNASKQAMIDSVRRLGYEPADDNEADALGLLMWAQDQRTGRH